MPSCPCRPTPLAVIGAVFAASLGLTACGGGEPDTTSAAAFLQLRGCVVDEHFIPRTATPVRAVSAQGRLLAHATSDAAGRFTMRLPPHTGATLAVDLPDGETLTVQVGAADLAVDTCLADRSA